MDRNYFASIPYDILEHICLYLNIVDIFQLSKLVKELANISYSKRFIQNVNLFNEYYIRTEHITQFFTAKPRCDFIVSLNLNCIYWIPAASLRKCIRVLRNLESLYVIDTNVGLLTADTTMYNKLPQLKKLGISLTERTFRAEELSNFPKITHLYLHIHLRYNRWHIIEQIISALCEHNSIREFWMIESENDLLWLCSYKPLIAMPDSVTELNLLRCYEEELTRKERVYRSTLGKRIISCWETRDQPILRLHDLYFNEDWNNFFYISKARYPFSPKQTKEIIDKGSLDGMNFDEILFAHDVPACSKLYREFFEKLILYDSMKSLKKLAINWCVCLAIDAFLHTKYGQLQNRKKIYQNKSLSDTEREKRLNDSLLNEICKNSPDIEELEIWGCLRVNYNEITKNSCSAFADFKYLRKLTLHNLPTYVSGAFLINVFSSCKHLSTLRIQSKQQNTSLHNFLCLSLAHAVSLKDLRYEHPCNISIDRLLLAITQNKNLRMERLFIKCKSVEIFNIKQMQDFIRASANLKFFYLVIEDLPEKVINAAMKSLAKYIEDPRKVVLITRSKDLSKDQIHIPFIHTYEMLSCHTHVGGLDIFNGFT